MLQMRTLAAGLVFPMVARACHRRTNMEPEDWRVESIAPSGWRCSNGVLRYCTVRPLGALWRPTVGGTGYPSVVSTSDGWSYPTPFWRLGVRTLSIPDPTLSRTIRPLGALWRPGVPSALPLSDGWNDPSPFWRLGRFNVSKFISHFGCRLTWRKMKQMKLIASVS
jgi:hypothetical protein